MRGRKLIGSLLLAMSLPALADGIGPNAQMGKTICKGPHLNFTPGRAMLPADEARARDILARMRKALEPYRDAQRAIKDGYVPFLPEVPQDVYHFAHMQRTAAEYSGQGALEQPGSLLYVKQGGKYRLVGAMLSAAQASTPEQLDRVIPLSVTHWHAHVNVCLPQGITLDDLVRGDFGASGAQLAGLLPEKGARAAINRRLNRQYGFMADGRFGFEGGIAERGICEAAGGRFYPQAWGWMAHVYPYAGDDLKLVFGESAPVVPSGL